MPWFHPAISADLYGGKLCDAVQDERTGSEVIRFGAFELDVGRAELRKHALRLRLQDQPFQVLTALLENPGEVVSRETLTRRLWREGTFVDAERGLNAAVNRLRQVLGDSAESPRYVETVARRGYRFIGPVSRNLSGPGAAPSRLRVPLIPAASPESRRWLAVAALAIAIAVFGYAFRTREPPTGPVMRQITNDTGLSTEPALSPDGRLIAYVSDRNARNLKLWVQQVAGGTPILLTDDDVDVHSPSFSPDGSKIVYRSEADGGGLYVVPALGGAPRRLVAGGRDPRYSPDGKWIAYWTGGYSSPPPNAVASGRVSVITSDGGTPRQLGKDLPAAVYPTWSQDSRYLVVYVDPKHSPQKTGADWWIVPIDGGRAARTDAFAQLAKHGIESGYGLEAPAISSWANGSILFSAKIGDAINVWSARLSAPEGTLSRLARITSGPGLEAHPSLAPDGALIFANLARNVSLYMLAGDADTASFGELRRVTEESGKDFTPYLSRDGRTLVYACGKEPCICLKNMATGEQRKLTDGPHWKPILSNDGTRVAYTASLGGPLSIFLSLVAGGPSEKLAEEGGWGFDWTPDDRRILFRKAHTNQVYSLDVSTREQEPFATWPEHSVFQTDVSTDGHWVTAEVVPQGSAASRLYVARLRDGAIAPTSEWIPVGFREGWNDKPRWSPNGSILYFISDQDGFRCLWAQRLDSKTKLPKGEPFGIHHLHNARLNMMNVGAGLLEISVAADKIVMNLGELTGNIWNTKH